MAPPILFRAGMLSGNGGAGSTEELKVIAAILEWLVVEWILGHLWLDSSRTSRCVSGARWVLPRSATTESSGAAAKIGNSWLIGMPPTVDDASWPKVPVGSLSR